MYLIIYTKLPSYPFKVFTPNNNMLYHSNAYIVKFLTAILEVQTMSAMKINTSMKSE